MSLAQHLPPGAGGGLAYVGCWAYQNSLEVAAFPHKTVSFGLGYWCGSSAPGDADAWGAIALVTEEGQDQTGRGEIELE